MEYQKAVIKHRFILMGAAAVIALGIFLAMRGAASANIHQAPPAPTVAVQTVSLQGGNVWSTFSGRMQAVDYAEVRPEVSGRITEVRFRDGQTVTAGQTLFVIDSRPFEASLSKAQADLASATSNEQLSKVEFDRATNLLQQQAIPQSVYDERTNAYHVAQNAVAAAEAEVKMANVAFDHAYIKSPITGRISRAEITVGNLVQAGSGAPLLASVLSNNGIYADFEIDEQTYIKSIRSHADTSAKAQKIPVELVVRGDDAHPYKGTIFSFDNHIDSSSGTIRARARFANLDGTLVPGMFVSVRLASHLDSPALLVSEQAIGYDQNKKFVFVVNAENKVVWHEVTLGDEIDGKRIVLSGLQAGDRVIVDGLQHIRPDMTVQPQEDGVAIKPAAVTAPVSSAAAKPIAALPLAAKSVVGKPLAAKPIVRKPVLGKPLALKPAVKPAVVQQAAVPPAAVKSFVGISWTQPADTQPVAAPAVVAAAPTAVPTAAALAAVAPVDAAPVAAPGIAASTAVAQPAKP